MTTSLEIEAKFKVASHDRVRERLAELGATKLGRVKESNTIFDDSKRSLRRAGKGLRVREVEILEGEAKSSTLTYKGPHERSRLKVRPEIEIEVSDAQSARQILQALGYEPFIVFEKIRESWRMAANTVGPPSAESETHRTCLVELDEVPLLGAFIEIEGASEAGVQDVRKKLGLEKAAVIPKSYIRMLMEFCQAAGVDSREIRFESPRPRPQ